MKGFIEVTQFKQNNIKRKISLNVKHIVDFEDGVINTTLRTIHVKEGYEKIGCLINNAQT